MCEAHVLHTLIDAAAEGINYCSVIATEAYFGVNRHP